MATDQLRALCESAPARRCVLSFRLITDRKGAGVILKCSMAGGSVERVFVPAAGVPKLIDGLKNDLPGMVIDKPLDIVGFEEQQPAADPSDFKIDAQDGHTLSVHVNLLAYLNAIFLVFTIYRGEWRVFRLHPQIAAFLLQDLELALPYMKVEQSPGSNNTRH